MGIGPRGRGPRLGGPAPLIGDLGVAYTEGNSVEGATAISLDSGRTRAQRPIEKNPYAFGGIVTLTVEGDKVPAAGEYPAFAPGGSGNGAGGSCRFRRPGDLAGGAVTLLSIV